MNHGGGNITRRTDNYSNLFLVFLTFFAGPLPRVLRYFSPSFGLLLFFRRKKNHTTHCAYVWPQMATEWLYRLRSIKLCALLTVRIGSWLPSTTALCPAGSGRIHHRRRHLHSWQPLSWCHGAAPSRQHARWGARGGAPSNRLVHRIERRQNDDSKIHAGLKRLLVNNFIRNNQPTPCETAQEGTDRRCERCGLWGKCDSIVLGAIYYIP
jgi:hypothetical protein